MSTHFFPPYTCLAPTLTKNLHKQSTHTFNCNTSTRKLRQNCFTSKATSSSSSSSSITDFDLYDLLGIDRSSNKSQIKTAYRTLQKQCHPDIAGPPGHDMAIILNEAYAVLSNPTSRSAYDKEQAKIEEVRGYTGKPIYSVWFGSESEKRAVFVDEVKCVGCLKCALFASNTFAIESVYGRARVVAQWADPEHRIHEAIDTCPVDCISMVERSDLAALEFLMSKQPRGNVRVGAGNSVGTRVSNIFTDVKKFQTRVVDAQNRAGSQSSKESDLQREARLSAIKAIRSISNWLHWQAPNAGPPTSESPKKITRIARKSHEPNINKLRDAAAARKQIGQSSRTVNKTPSDYIYHDEYWIPKIHALPGSMNTNSSTDTDAKPRNNKEHMEKTEGKDYSEREKNQRKPIRWEVPLGMGMIASIIRTQVGERAVHGVEEHIAGSLVLEIVNSSWLQVALAGVTWYLMGVLIVQFIEAFQDR